MSSTVLRVSETDSVYDSGYIIDYLANGRCSKVGESFVQWLILTQMYTSVETHLTASVMESVDGKVIQTLCRKRK